MKNELNFKIDLQLCKNSHDGKIISKVKNFQEQIKIHDEHGDWSISKFSINSINFRTNYFFRTHRIYLN